MEETLREALNRHGYKDYSTDQRRAIYKDGKLVDLMDAKEAWEFVRELDNAKGR